MSDAGDVADAGGDAAEDAAGDTRGDAASETERDSAAGDGGDVREDAP